MTATLPVPSLSGLDAADIEALVAAGRRFERSLRGARILVTGATGWFGTWLLEALVALDRSLSLALTVVAVSRSPAAFARRHPALHAADAIEWVEADVRDSLVDAPGPFTHIIHAAADTSTKAVVSTPDWTFETLVLGTLNVMKLAACHPRAKVLVVSSGAVYGPQPAGVDRLTEQHGGAPDPLDATSAYAEGKRAAEHVSSIWHATHGVHVTIARCFAFVGPHMPLDAHFAIGNFIRDALDDRTIQVAGDGRPRRSYLYMSDLVVWLLAILVDGRPMRPYNVGGDEPVTIAALAEHCATCAPRGHGAVRVAGHAGSGRDYVPDVTRAMRELDVRVTIPLDAAIARTAAWAARRQAARRPEPARP